MPSHARKDILPPGEICVAHVWSRCVQRAFLTGVDHLTGNDYTYRLPVIQELLEYLTSIFAVDVGNYHLLHNHLHAIVRARPDVAQTWSDEEVAWKWKCAWPSYDDGVWHREPTDEEIELLLLNADKIGWMRANLANISWLMALWKKPLAQRFNQEVGAKGHFFEQRFGSRLLETEADVLRCSLYVDINQYKAGAAPSLEESDFSAIQDRIRAERSRSALESMLAVAKEVETPEEGEENAAVIERLFTDCWLAPIDLERVEPLLCDPLAASDEEKTRAEADGGTAEPEERDTAAASGEESAESSDSASEGTSEEAADEAADEAPDEAGSDLPAAESKGDETTPSDADTGGETGQPENSGDSAESVQPGDQASGDRPKTPPSKRDTNPFREAAKQIPARKPKAKTKEIHRRLSRKRRRRTSSEPILAMPFSQYLELAEWAAVRSRPDAPSPPDKSIERTRAAPDDTPSTWRRTMKQFEVWLRELLSSESGPLADRLRDLLKRPPPDKPES